MPSVESNNYAKVISKIGQVEREKGYSGLIVRHPLPWAHVFKHRVLR